MTHSERVAGNKLVSTCSSMIFVTILHPPSPTETQTHETHQHAHTHTHTFTLIFVHAYTHTAATGDSATA